MIQIKNLTKRYEDKVVLNNVTVEIPDGSIVGLVGINGVGKSTMLRLMAGIYEPDSGDIFFDGKSIFQDESVKRELYYVPDEPYFSFRDTPDKLIKENQFWLDKPCAYINFIHYLNKFNISTSKHLFTFSKGMKRQTSLAFGLSAEPKYLFLDEAFDGVDPLARKDLKGLLLENQKKNNSTVILASHSIRELEGLCDSYLVVDKGNAVLYDDISKFSYHKYVMAFAEPVDKESFHIHFASFEQDNKLISCVTKLEYSEMKKVASAFPLKYLEEQEMSVEEAFITKLEEEGEECA